MHTVTSSARWMNGTPSHHPATLQPTSHPLLCQSEACGACARGLRSACVGVGLYVAAVGAWGGGYVGRRVVSSSVGQTGSEAVSQADAQQGGGSCAVCAADHRQVTVPQPVAAVAHHR